MQYRSLFRKGGIPEFIKANPHLLLLLFWPIFFAFFMIEENLIVENYTTIYIPLDDLIPFCKWFAIPYVLWYPYIVFPLLFLMTRNIPEFKRLMWFIMLTYTVTLVVYAVFPNGQDLRPQTVEGDGLIALWMRFLYSYDTNTNVCPSIHVIGTLAITFSLLHTKAGKKWWSFIIIALLTASICLSIVFVKQHSIVDLFAGAALCAVAYPFIYNKKMKKRAESEKIMPFSFPIKKQ